MLTATARRQAEPEIARARSVLLSTHAHLVEGIVSRLGNRLTTSRVVELYSRAQKLEDFDEQWLRIRAVAHAGHGGVDNVDSVGGVAGDVAEHFRDSVLPYRDAELRALLASEFAVARATIIRVHVRNAVRLARTLAPDTAAPAAVALYIRCAEPPDDVAGAVHAFAVEHLASHTGAGLLPAGRDLTLRSGRRRPRAAAVQLTGPAASPGDS
jgi:hypothetical protein